MRKIKKKYDYEEKVTVCRREHPKRKENIIKENGFQKAIIGKTENHSIINYSLRVREEMR